MSINKIKFLFILSIHLFYCSIFLSGCKTDAETIILQKNESEDSVLQDEIIQQDAEQTQQSQNEDESVSNQDVLNENEAIEEETQDAYVYVCGAVQYPGVYRIEANARVFEAIALAGGLREDACQEAINQAEIVQDGQRIVVPTISQWEKDGAVIENAEKETSSNDLVNINTADEKELCELSGIGQAKAEAIVQYRQENGNFSSVDEIKNVTGIGEGLYNRIKDKIKV